MLSREALGELREGVTGAADEAGEWVASELSAYMGSHPEATVEGLRERAIDALLTADSTFGDRACELAAQAFEETCPGARPAVLADAMGREEAGRVARYQAGKLRRDDRGGFVEQVAQAARGRAVRRANETTARNAARNVSRGVRYARIPTGGETCPWCLMLASRGFVYRSAGAAAHSHRGCDCICVAAADVDADGRGEGGEPAVEGYDRSPYLDAYARALESEELTPSQLARAAKRAGASSSTRSYKALIADVSGAADERELEEAYVIACEQMALRGASAATRGRLAEAMRERRHELEAVPSDGMRRGGELDSGVCISRVTSRELKVMKRDKPNEWDGYVTMARLGYDPELLHEDKSMSANIDVILSVGGEDHYWDLKTPMTNARSLRKRLTEGYSKWTRLREPGANVPGDIDLAALGDPRLVVDNRFSEMTDAEAKGQIADSMRYLSAHGDRKYAQTLLIGKDSTAELIEQ